MSHIRLTARNTSIGNKSQQAYKYQQNLPTTQVGVWFDTFCRLNMAPNLFSRDAHYRVLKVQPAGQQTEKGNNTIVLFIHPQFVSHGMIKSTEDERFFWIWACLFQTLKQTEPSQLSCCLCVKGRCSNG